MDFFKINFKFLGIISGQIDAQKFSNSTYRQIDPAILPTTIIERNAPNFRLCSYRANTDGHQRVRKG